MTIKKQTDKKPHNLPAQACKNCEFYSNTHLFCDNPDSDMFEKNTDEDYVCSSHYYCTIKFPEYHAQITIKSKL